MVPMSGGTMPPTEIHPPIETLEESSTSITSHEPTQAIPKLFEVEAIVGHRPYRGRYRYIVRWKDYPPSFDEARPAQALRGAQELVDAYKVKVGILSDTVKLDKKLHSRNSLSGASM